MEALLRDFRLACRQIIRRPRSSILVVLCATLAIGLNATIFSLVKSVALFEPAAENPEELVRLYGTYPGFDTASLSYPNFVDLRDRNTVFQDLTAFSVAPANLSIDGRHERLPAVLATGNYFETLGVKAARGRVFGPEVDETRLGHPVAVIGDHLWRTRFGADPEIVGRKVLINSQPFTILGVTSPEWQGTFPGLVLDLWVPMQMQPLLQPANATALESRGWGWLMTAGRLKPGVGQAQAQAGLDVTVAGLVEEFPRRNENWGVAIHRGVVPFPPAMQKVLGAGSLAMMALVGCVLLIACANVAGLLLARAEERQREIGIRLAIGAGRGRLVRQLLVESVVLASFSGGFGTLLALGASRVFPSLFPSLGGFPVVVDVAPDAGVYAFTLGLTLLTGLVFGLLPSLQSTRPDLVPVLKGESGSRIGRTKLPMRRLLVGFQVAMSMLLLATAGLFLTSLERERDVDLGFEAPGMLLAGLDPSLHGHDEASGLALLQDLRQRLEAVPGIEKAAFGQTVPMTLAHNQQTTVAVEGYVPAEGERMNPEYNIVSEGYFATLGVRLEEGRPLTSEDDVDGRKVVVVNRAMADRYWPEGGALGGRLSSGGIDYEVVGIAANGRYLSRRESPQPHLYFSLHQVWEPTQQIHLRTTTDAASQVAPLRRVLAELDPEVALYDVRTMDQHLEQSLMLQKLGTQLVGLFGGLALVLAAIGLFGLLTHAVVSRTREIGIRMSIGARTADVFGHFLRQGATLVAVGLVLGGGAAIAAGKLLSGLLYDVSGFEPSILVGVSLVLGFTAFLAIAFPAWRATRVDPVIALRQD